MGDTTGWADRKRRRRSSDGLNAALLLLYVALLVAVLGGEVWVIWHFIHKFW